MLAARAHALVAPSPVDLSGMSLEELGQLQVVTSVTGRPTRLQDAAASIYVITAEDIRRSTATTLPEALHLAPNLQVAETNAGQYAIGARGFNNGIGNKLLVLIDGRIVYSPLFSGVFWDEQDLLLADIERIEVISGPGATLWGANAVNGVINIITKPAASTAGGYAEATGGGRGSQLGARYGAAIDDHTHYRVYAKRLNRSATELADGTELPDAAGKSQAGFRVDWQHAGAQATLQGDAYHGGDSPASNLSPRLAGGNLLGRWQQQREDGSNWQLRLSYDRASREDNVLFYENTETLDLQFSHALSPTASQQMIWGGGYRHARSETQANALVSFDPPTRGLQWANVFAQDEMRMSPALKLTLGAKVETNDYTGAEFLPTIRLAHELGDDRLLWAEASRSVRAPARLDRDFHLPGHAPYIIEGGPGFVSETANTAELGYRARPNERLDYSLTAYYTQYNHLRAGRNAPTFIENLAYGHTTGLEAWGNAALTPRWRIAFGITTQHKSLAALPEAGPGSVANLGNDPSTQWQLRSLADLGHGIDFDLTVRRAGALPQPAVPAYTATDLRLAWRATPTLTAALLVQNAFDPQHVEFDSPGSEIDRAAFLRLTWAMR
jgi:iron complex outermembrane receptor protein